MDDVKNFLRSISNETGISGYETRVAQLVKDEFSKYCDSVSVDKLGNVIALRKGKGKGKIMFAAHIDEIGLMAKCVDEDGFLRFTSVGGYDQRVLMSQEVIVHGKEKLFGVIGLKPPHLSTPEDKDKAVKFDDLAIDLGLPKEKAEELVKPGDLICLNMSMVELQGDMLSGKAFDDRAGVAALLVCMKSLESFSHDMDVYYVATTQEEVGLHGAKVSSYTIQPDVAIAIDVGFGRTPDLKEYESIELSKGPAIAKGPNMHPAVFEGLRDVAKDNNLCHQIEVIHGYSGTDAMELQIAGIGVASGLLSIPLKYMHTCVETISFKDVIQTGKLLSGYIMSLNGCDLEAKLCL